MTIACREVIWLIFLLKDLGISHTKAVELFSDNQSTLHISKNQIYHEITKHVKVDCHFIRGKVLPGIVTPKYVHIKLQKLDLFTKALQLGQFYNLISRLKIYDIHV